MVAAVAASVKAAIVVEEEENERAQDETYANTKYLDHGSLSFGLPPGKRLSSLLTLLSLFVFPSISLQAHPHPLNSSSPFPWPYL